MTMMTISRQLTALMVLCGAAWMPVGAATTLVQQGPLSGGVALDAVYSSLGQFGFQNAESMTLAAPAQVTGLRWWGSQLDDLGLFVVRQFTGLATAPDAFRVLSGSLTRSAGPSAQDSSGQPMYAYELTLDQPFDVVAGELQFSIFVDSDAATWFWLAGSSGDGSSALRGVDGTDWDWLEPDLSLAVLGDWLGRGLPLPGSGALVLAALGVVVLRVKRPRAALRPPRRLQGPAPA
jgi:hypothetical protein